MTLDIAEPDLSVIVTGQGSFSQRQDFGEQLLEIARGAGHSAELIVAETQPTAADEEKGIVRAVSRARGKFVAFCDPASGLAPETLIALVAPLADDLHDLAIAVRNEKQSGAALTTLATRFKALLLSLIHISEPTRPY